MSAGLIDRNKKDSFSLFRQKATIFVRFFASYAVKASMGRKSPLRPLARMCARYFESLDSNESASLGESPKCLISASRNSSKSESAADTSRFGSMSFIAISAV